MWGVGRAGGLGRGRGCSRGSREQLSGFLQPPPPPPQFRHTRKDCAPGRGWGEFGPSLLLQEGGRPHSSPVLILQPCVRLTSLGRPDCWPLRPPSALSLGDTGVQAGNDFTGGRLPALGSRVLGSAGGRQPGLWGFWPVPLSQCPPHGTCAVGQPLGEHPLPPHCRGI